MIRKASRRFPLLVRIGQILSVLIVILWLCSLGRQIRHTGGHHAIDLATNGNVCYWWHTSTLGLPNSQRGFSARPLGFLGVGAVHPMMGATGGWFYILIPFWTVFIAVATPTAILWYRHRNRLIPGFCSKCSYDLTGNESGICPECGTEVKRP